MKYEVSAMEILRGVMRRAAEGTDFGTSLEPSLRREIASLFNDRELDDVIEAASWLVLVSLDEKRARRAARSGQ